MNNKWDNEDLESDILLLKNLKDKVNKKDKAIVLDDIYKLSEFLDDKVKIEKVEYIIQNMMILDKYKYILKELGRFNTLFQERDISHLFLPLSDSYYSDNDVLCFINDFYKSLGNDIYDNFSINFRKKDYNFKFIDGSFNNRYGLFAGFTIAINYLKKNYIEVENANSVQKIMYATHEYAHATAREITSYKKINDEISEVESLFMELLAIDYYKNLLGKNDFDKYAYNNLNSMLNSANYVIRVNNAYKTINKMIKSNTNIDEIKNFDIFKDMDSYVIADIIYPHCYLLAVELYEEYKIDPEKALYKYKKIINNNVLYSKIFIKPNDNITNYGDEVIKLVKKLD